MLERYSIIGNIAAIQDYLMDASIDAGNEGKTVECLALAGASGLIDGIEAASLVIGGSLLALGAYYSIKSKFE